MSCFDCATRSAQRRVDRFMKSGGNRLCLPCPGGFHVVTILGVTQSNNELRLRDERGREFDASACQIPLIAFAGVA